MEEMILRKAKSEVQNKRLSG